MRTSAVKYINWRLQSSAKLVLFFRVFISFGIQRFIVVWVLLEVNFLAFVAILTKSSFLKYSNKTLNYFLVQAIGRGLVLIIVFITLLQISFFLLIIIYFLSLLIKLGGAPFHAWYLRLIQKLSWEIIWVLSIWQKVIPLLLFSKPRSYLTILAGALRVVIRRVSRISQKNVKKILGLSSIFSLGWILVSFDLNKFIWTQFILGYGASLLVLLSRLKRNNHKIVQDFNKEINRVSILSFFMGFLMLRGIPPFIGFFLKMLILLSFISKRLILVLTFLIFSLLIIFVYLNVIFMLFTFVSKKFSFSKLAGHRGYFLIDLLVLNCSLSVLFLINFCNLLHK
jgi:NADH:ubiquinone oxidoreductase subunit 2 (subunit N)